MTILSETAAKRHLSQLQDAIVDGLEDIKAQNIVVFDTTALSPLFERVIVASATSSRQTKALAASVRDKVKEVGHDKPRVEGEDNGEWIIVDCGSIVTHIMQPAIREYYRLEEIWGEKPLKAGAAAKKAAKRKTAAKDVEASAEGKKAAKSTKQPAKAEGKSTVKAAVSTKGAASKPAAKKKAQTADAKAKPAAKTTKKAADKPVAVKKVVVKTSAESTAAKKPAVRKSVEKKAAPKTAASKTVAKVAGVKPKAAKKAAPKIASKK